MKQIITIISFILILSSCSTQIHTQTSSLNYTNFESFNYVELYQINYVPTLNFLTFYNYNYWRPYRSFYRWSIYRPYYSFYNWNHNWYYNNWTYNNLYWNSWHFNHWNYNNYCYGGNFINHHNNFYVPNNFSWKSPQNEIKKVHQVNKNYTSIKSEQINTTNQPKKLERNVRMYDEPVYRRNTPPKVNYQKQTIQNPQQNHNKYNTPTINNNRQRTIVNNGVQNRTYSQPNKINTYNRTNNFIRPNNVTGTKKNIR